MINYPLKKISLLEDEEILYVRKETIYKQMLFYEQYQNKYTSEIANLSKYVVKFMRYGTGCRRIEMCAKDIRENFIDMDLFPIDSFIKYHS